MTSPLRDVLDDTMGDQFTCQELGASIISLVCEARATRKFSPWCQAPQALANCPSQHRSTRIRSYGRKEALQKYPLGSD